MSFQLIDKRIKTKDTVSNFNKNLNLQNKKDKKNNNGENLNFPYLSSFYYSNFNFLDNKPIIQTKLKVSQTGDEYEREADRVAEQVMRMSPTPEKSHLSMKKSNDDDNKKLNRKCTSCEEEEEEENEELKNINISRKENDGLSHDFDISDNISKHVKDGLSQQGSPLDSSTREFMESRLGSNFGKVRIRNDSRSDQLTRSVNARAFTFGSNIFLSKNESVTDKRLLAHELAHVVQQRALLEQEIQRQPKNAVTQRQVQRQAVEGGGATPGVGEGIDLIFIIKAGKDEKDEFTAEMTKYVKTVLEGQEFFEVDNLDDIFDRLAGTIWRSRGREKIRRIRIVAHGQESIGGVMMSPRSNPRRKVGDMPQLEKRRFILSSDLVKKFVDDASQQDVVRSVMTENAVVEFWGCNLGDVPHAGEDWSRIFNSTFKAPIKTFRTGFDEYYRGARKNEEGETVIVQGKPKKVVRVKNTSEIDELSRADQTIFTRWLLKIYGQLVINGDILPRKGTENQLNYMRDLFNRSEGHIKHIEIVDETQKPLHPIRPGQHRAWKTHWKEFTFRIGNRPETEKR